VAAGIITPEDVVGPLAGQWDAFVAALEYSARTEALIVGKPAPDFAGKTIDGYEFRLSDYRGKVVLLDFYGFW